LSSDIEAGEVEELQYGRILEQADQVLRPLAALRDLHDIGVPSPRESWTTQSRSRCGLRPSVSVSIATLDPAS
jgi:hypothetical protein